MKRKWLRAFGLVGLLSLMFTYNIIAMETTEEPWDKVIHTQVPLGRKQLEKYKEIYGNHLNKGGSFDEPIEGLEVPLWWAYRSAYTRLEELEKKDSSVEERLGKKPTAALRQLF